MDLSQVVREILKKKYKKKKKGWEPLPCTAHISAYVFVLLTESLCSLEGLRGRVGYEEALDGHAILLHQLFALVLLKIQPSFRIQPVALKVRKRSRLRLKESKLRLQMCCLEWEHFHSAVSVKGLELTDDRTANFEKRSRITGEFVGMHRNDGGWWLFWVGEFW